MKECRAGDLSVCSVVRQAHGLGDLGKGGAWEFQSPVCEMLLLRGNVLLRGLRDIGRVKHFK